MPTKTEQVELINKSYTTWTWTTQNGVKGYKVTSKINGNSIFLPAAGYRSSDLYHTGSISYYWGSSLATDDNSDDADIFYFNSDYVRSFISSRYYGRSVRPVMAKPFSLSVSE